MSKELSDIYEVNVDADYTVGQVFGILGLGGCLVWAIFFFPVGFVPDLQQAVVAATSTDPLNTY